ncbi:ATP-binding protein, partial [Rhizobium ruizarguesonis]
SYVSLPLSLLNKEIRRPGRVDLVSCLKDIIKTFELIFSNAGISVETDLPSSAAITGSVALVEGILANLFANAIAAFERDDIDQSDRKIFVKIQEDLDQITMVISDNDGGIKGVDLKEIWLPGITTSPEGTGFGLTIVRDSVADLGGTVEAIALGEDGGAEFRINLKRPTV